MTELKKWQRDIIGFVEDKIKNKELASKKWIIGNYAVIFDFFRTEKVYGINSSLKDGRHILMWEFDKKRKSVVIDSLTEVQYRYQLPSIYVFKSRPKLYYHAYCLARTSFKEAIEIMAATRNIDLDHLRLGAMRGYWTLRISPKNGYGPEPDFVLKSHYPDEVSFWELSSVDRYRSRVT